MTINYHTKRKSVTLFNVYKLDKDMEVTRIWYYIDSNKWYKQKTGKKHCIILKNSGLVKLISL